MVSFMKRSLKITVKIMARSLQEIKLAIQTDVRTYPSLDGFKFPSEGGSQVSIFNLMITVVSTAILVFEKIHDIFKEDLTDLANSAIAGNTYWLQAQMLNFQYGDQILLDENFSPYYLVEDDSKKIVTRCAVLDANPVLIKVATGIVPNLTQLSAAQMSALQDYYYGTQFNEGIGFAGVTATFISELPDRMFIEADIYYSSQLVTATVKTNTINAIDNFFATFQNTNFDGTVFMIKLTDAIQAVIGVTRVVYTDVKGRNAATDISLATPIDFQGSYQTEAGYLISEDTPTYILDDTLTMIAEG